MTKQNLQSWMEGIPLLVPFTQDYGRKLHVSELSRLVGVPKKDLDLVAFTSRQEQVKQILEKYPIATHVQYASFNQFARLLREKQPLAQEIRRHHVLIGRKEEIISSFISVTKP